MHNFTHVKAANHGNTGLGEYADGMIEHDAQIGEILEYSTIWTDGQYDCGIHDG